MQGHSDIPLNQKGEAQALRLAQLVSTLKIEVVVSSDLQRARQTARLAFPNQELQLDERLRELFLGQAEGLTRDAMAKNFGTEFVASWSSGHPDHLHLTLPGSESTGIALQRLEACLHEWLHKNAGKRVAFVTHGMLIRLLAQKSTGTYQNEKFRSPNCAVHEFANHGPRLRLRQIYHLPD